ncbi:phage tail tube protein [Rubinisphaera sp.]|uniref:phage tail tube protein n=1 Tax=Rubinisphaera sp. TaxID=2024857 RepID=UPI000C10AAEA|nr:phage tail tube protein [Rubinisphaera sp.]MBV07681.1 hypothetical protein [Rubinisphaera sp.]HCS53287.1 hypothetical protein [Planctomycetaceae bacterium]|tara:strand:- start:22 stop:435 length:414 start_codon:yes stop_codon:yes gene_type:complete
MPKQTSNKTELQLEISSVYTKVAYVESIDGPDTEGQFWDATDLDSDDIEDGEPTGQCAPGSVSGEAFYDPNDATHQAIIARKLAGTKSNWKIKYPDDSEIAFEGTPRKFTPKAAKGDGLKASFEIKLSSVPVYPAAE